MAHCDVIPLEAAKACSGKCRGGACGAHANIWVLAACEGMGALFMKQADGHLVPLPHDGHATAPFVDTLRAQLAEAAQHARFSQLVLVAGAGDMSWLHLSLPEEVSKHVVAEIEYPLMPSWFKTPAEAGRLAQALQNVL